MLVDVYNAVVDHMVRHVTSPALRDLSWPVPEFTDLHPGTCAMHSGLLHPVTTCVRFDPFGAPFALVHLVRVGGGGRCTKC